MNSPCIILIFFDFLHQNHGLLLILPCLVQQSVEFSHQLAYPTINSILTLLQECLPCWGGYRFRCFSTPSLIEVLSSFIGVLGILWTLFLLQFLQPHLPPIFQFRSLEQWFYRRISLKFVFTFQVLPHFPWHFSRNPLYQRYKPWFGSKVSHKCTCCYWQTIYNSWIFLISVSNRAYLPLRSS